MIMFNEVTSLSHSLWFAAYIFLFVLFFTADVLSYIIVTLLRSEVLVEIVLIYQHISNVTFHQTLKINVLTRSRICNLPFPLN